MKYFGKISLLMTLGLVCLCTAEIRPGYPFDPVEDAARLHNAMAGWGTDEDVLTNILTHRILAQRLEIANVYKTKYNRNLESDLEDDLSGDYLKLMLALLRPLAVSKYLRTEDYAKRLYDAMKGWGTDEDTLIDIIVGRSEYDLDEIAKTFQDFYGESLAAYVIDDTSGDFKRALLSIIEG